MADVHAVVGRTLAAPVLGQGPAIEAPDSQGVGRCADLLAGAVDDHIEGVLLSMPVVSRWTFARAKLGNPLSATRVRLQPTL